MSELSPIVPAIPVVDLYIPTLSEHNLRSQVKLIKMKAMVNNGYVFKIVIYNANFTMFNKMSKGTRLFEELRQNPMLIRFRIIDQKGGEYPQTGTRWIGGFVVTMRSFGHGTEEHIEFIALDPLNYFLRNGDADGGAFVGKASTVMRDIIEKYAPQIRTRIADSTDNIDNVWWMLRRSPREMLSHLITLAPSLGQQKTHWLIGTENNNVIIGPQTSYRSKRRGEYKYLTLNQESNVASWDSLINTGLSHTQMGIVTAGASAATGNYIDQQTSPETAIITDSNTDKKFVQNRPNRNTANSTIRPEIETFSRGLFGRSFEEAPPEYYGAEDIGLKYEEYYDSYARYTYFKAIHQVFTMDLQVLGHGEWDTSIGLGVDTVYLDWWDLQGVGTTPYYFRGSWIVYGFRQEWVPGKWTTTLKLARLDMNATGQRIGDL